MTEHTPQFFLYDSELLDLGSYFTVYHSVPADSCHGRVIRNQQNLFPIFLLLP